MSRSPIGIAVQRAVCDPSCTLPPGLRHLIMVLAVLADRRTGRGLASQATIGAALGVSERSARRLLAELGRRCDSPVLVSRRPRMRRDGRGRTSDAYQLSLADQPDTDVRKDTHDQPDTDDRMNATTNRTRRDDQPDKSGTTNRTPVSGDPGSDPGSDPSRSISPRRRAAGSVPEFALESPAPEPSNPTRPKRRKAPTPKRTRTDAEVASQREILDAYGAAVLAKTGSAPTIGSREAASAWKLLDWTKGDGARAVAIVRGAVAREFGGTTSISVIAADPNKYLGSARPITRGAAPKQPNAGTYKPAIGDF